MTELVHLEVADQVATITLDSERNRNALSKQLVTELAAHLATADADAAGQGDPDPLGRHGLLLRR